jgi:hypothetical protein
MISRELWAWMAGFFDGEGTLSILKQVRKGRPSPAFRGLAVVSNTERELLNPFRELIGGEIYERPDHRTDQRGLRWATAYTWHCPDSKIVYLVEGMLPYLRGKKFKCAKILLEFMAHKKSFLRRVGSLVGGKRGGSASLGQEEIEFRDSLWIQIRLLNTKGRFSRATRGGDSKCPSTSISTGHVESLSIQEASPRTGM